MIKYGNITILFAVALTSAAPSLITKAVGTDILLCRFMQIVKKVMSSNYS